MVAREGRLKEKTLSQLMKEYNTPLEILLRRNDKMIQSLRRKRK